MTENRLADRMSAVEQSPIRQMFDLAKRVEAAGNEDLVHLEIGEPDFDTPSHIIQAAFDAASAGETHYTSNAGLPALREAIAESTDTAHGFTVDPTEEVLVTTGAMEALALAMLVTVNPGDEVILPSPSWPNYRTQVILAGATPVEVPLDADDGFSLDPEQVIESMTDRTAAVVLATPSNPTGRVADPDAVRTIVDAAVDRGAYVIADEVYSRLLYGKYQTGIAGYVDSPDRVLTVESCSKTFAMTGWRVGWLLGPEDAISAATVLRESTTACTSSISQHAAIAALNGPMDEVDAMRSAFEERRDYVVDRIADIDGISCPSPEGAFYVFIDVTEFGDSSLAMAKELLEDYDVVTTPGAGFGEAGEGQLRLSFANNLSRIEEGLDRIKAFAVDHQ
ncbi:pyridoxal phosphate-dependent aminotransferase [Haladaptatus caseinilyticus]|uniref:pyridoxal phosphate-dependent aminotransferase n=1 Tax=Haladaptatus caseinilyticus TaxID=2993314 RepID=UPI00224AA711|nr:pyridoxal phosphate-dependent aminotransferase [Haladaptatus caseinilyticus]